MKLHAPSGTSDIPVSAFVALLRSDGFFGAGDEIAYSDGPNGFRLKLWSGCYEFTAEELTEIQRLIPDLVWEKRPWEEVDEATPRSVVSSLIEGGSVISPESLAEILGRLLANSPEGVVVQTHYGNLILGVTEVWEAEGRVHIAVELPPNP